MDDWCEGVYWGYQIMHFPPLDGWLVKLYPIDKSEAVFMTHSDGMQFYVFPYPELARSVADSFQKGTVEITAT